MINFYISYVRKYLRKIPALYRPIRYGIMLSRHYSSNRLLTRFYPKKISSILKDFNFEHRYQKTKLPRVSLIEITNTCNLNCVMCNTKLSSRPIGFMEPRVFEIILQQLRSIGIDYVGLHTVGETFMYKDLEVLFKIIEDYGFSVWLSTNGQFPKRVEQLYRAFPYSANFYRISADGATRKTYELIRQGGSFDKLIETLEIIHKINSRRKDYRIGLLIGSILCMANIFELPLFFKVYGKYCRPENINFRIPHGRALDSSYLKKEFPFPNLIRHNIPCNLPFRNIFFTYSGKATLCCVDYQEELVIGDIQKKSIIELWNSKEAENIHQGHLNPDKLNIQACRTCFAAYDLLSDIVNKYIHFLMAHSPALTPQEFGEKIISFLSDMDFSMQKKDIEKFRQCVSDVFKNGA